MDRSRHDSKAGVRRSEGTSCELLTQHPQVQVDREQVSLTLKVSWACHEVTSRNHPHGRVLHSLQLLDVG